MKLSHNIATAVTPVQLKRNVLPLSTPVQNSQTPPAFSTDKVTLSTSARHNALRPAAYAIHQSFNINTVFHSPAGLSVAGRVRLMTASRSLSLKRLLDKHQAHPAALRFKVVGQRTLAGAAFGAVGSAIGSTINIATGKWSGKEATEFAVKDIIKGTAGGAGFGLGMSLSVMALTHMGVAGLPLTIAGIVTGSALSIVTYMGVDKALEQWKWS